MAQSTGSAESNETGDNALITDSNNGTEVANQDTMRQEIQDIKIQLQQLILAFNNALSTRQPENGVNVADGNGPEREVTTMDASALDTTTQTTVPPPPVVAPKSPSNKRPRSEDFTDDVCASGSGQGRFPVSVDRDEDPQPTGCGPDDDEDTCSSVDDGDLHISNDYPLTSDTASESSGESEQYEEGPVFVEASSDAPPVDELSASEELAVIALKHNLTHGSINDVICGYVGLWASATTNNGIILSEVYCTGLGIIIAELGWREI
ncbi:hypothetical protein HPB47_015774 [Ixodes persulcatus]|uniref:Uncharacterized protein n=1 Tax=Ixodes persulcatus TaxID=34615 RepID=A0AC60QSJ7_IXOPE|nr:hypothetical protein HPB47_015774 [Ixodes persulcatus]